MDICEHIDCWRDCEKHPDQECYVLDCPHNEAPLYDCDDLCDECGIPQRIHDESEGEDA